MFEFKRLGARAAGYAADHGPIEATIEEFAADGFTHVECFCPRCRVIRLRPMSWLPRISLGLTISHSPSGFAVPIAAVRFTRSRPGEWRT